VIRICRCGTVLSRYNPENVCAPCQERDRLATLAQEREIVEDTRPTGNPSGLCKCGCGEMTEIAKMTRTVDNIAAGMPLHFKRGHGNTHRGRTNGNSKMTEHLVREMRSVYAQGGTSYRLLAKTYGISESAVRQAIKRVSWAHILDEAA
jgi:hypothetical protein